MKPIRRRSGFRIFGLASMLALVLISPCKGATLEQNFPFSWTADLWDDNGTIHARKWGYDNSYVPFSSLLGTLTRVEVQITIDVSDAAVGDTFNYGAGLFTAWGTNWQFGVDGEITVASSPFRVQQTFTYTNPSDLANWIDPYVDPTGSLPNACSFETTTKNAAHTQQGNLRLIFEYETPYAEVAIDIKPGSYPNTFNQNNHGVIPVAVLGNASINVREINIASLFLQGLSVKAAGKSDKYLSHFEDVNSDGYEDLVIQFQDSDAWVVDGSDTAVLTGLLSDGTEIRGADTIQIVP